MSVFMQERVQKILASAGIGSRRECEKLITQGCVTINGAVVTDLGIKVDAHTAAIKVHGKLLQAATIYQYLIVHKPQGVLTMMKPDPEGRPTLLNLFKRKPKTRVFPVGRLDINSEGLVLLTNDGELTYRMTHPKFKLPKTYEVRVHGLPSKKILDILSHGVNLEDGRTQPAKVRIIRTTGKNTWLKFTIVEGKKRQIRRMCEKVHLPVSKLNRIMIGPLTLRGLERGQFRFLTDAEIVQLKEAVQLQ
jgi:23S rRNA pseudouridine2605 synthase/16S rRNA pseudouridine516 synthase